MQVVNRKTEIGYLPIVTGAHHEKVCLEEIENAGDRKVYSLKVQEAHTDQLLYVKVKLKALNAKGSWSSNAVLDKRFRTDWEMPQIESSISIDAPIINLFGHDDENLITISCSDAINAIKFEASLREEDNHFYCILTFFDNHLRKGDYKTKICIDQRKNLSFSESIQGAANWILKENHLYEKPVPSLAKVPLYSTWYSFHQDLDEDDLINECRVAKDLGYDLIIIDDGWQTMDNGRGYDYTGDWNPDRFKDPSGFVKQVQGLDMAIMFWYSVPFCGKKSKAYQKFKDKLLTEKHYWAPVFDPRFPEVREYLVSIYSKALINWNIDGFKLDFIDDFKVYPETETESLNGRDTLSVSEGTEKLIQEVAAALHSIKPDVLIEFRQKYISPSLHKLGNMFRAFDCPNDSLMNRVRTTDVKLICGQGAVHSDMITWHKEEPVEVAALQLSSLIFSVPQLSIRLADRSPEEIEMIRFYTKYWRDNKDVLLDGNFKAYKPLANYPYLSASKNGTTIYGLYEDVVLPLPIEGKSIHIINGKTTDSVVVRFEGSSSKWKKKVQNCMGEIRENEEITLSPGLREFTCPPNGLIILNSET